MPYRFHAAHRFHASYILHLVFGCFALMFGGALYLQETSASMSAFGRDVIFVIGLVLLPGRWYAQRVAAHQAADEVTAAVDADAPDAATKRPPVTLVFFLGGCTFAEIAALRWLGRNGSPRRDYIIATTHICNGDTLMESLITTCDNQLAELND